MASCISLPDIDADLAGETLGEVSWPMIVQGIEVYACHQPPEVASELLRLAGALSGIVELKELGSDG